MSTPTTSDREKISEKLLKEWEHIEDEALIREVATKGKYINFLLSFLAKRNNKSIGDIKHYFNAEIDKYVHRLLTNRQVHKAELVLKNVGRQSQPIFYEFVQSTSQEHIDDDIKERVLEHLQKYSDCFDNERDEYDYYLLVLKLVAANKVLRRQFENEIHVYTLEVLFRKDADFRKLMAVTTCMHCKNAALVEKLDKHITWTYLWKTEQFQYIAKWLDLCFVNKTGGLLEVSGTKKEPCFDVALKNQFLSWDIEQAMFETIQTNAKIKNFVLNSLAKNGMIFDREKDSTVKIFQRIFTTQSLQSNEQWLMTDEYIQKMIRIIFDQDALSLLMEKLFCAELIVQASSNYAKIQNEIDLCIDLKSFEFSDQKSISQLSSTVSQYILQTADADFYCKWPHIYLLEQMLNDVDIKELANGDATQAIIGKIPFFDIFFKKLRTTRTVTDYDVTLTDLLKLKNLDVAAIKCEAFASASNVETSEDNLVSFSNQTLSQKYAQSVTLSYIDYVKQHRSSYAVYKFFIDQLTNYSQISRAQIQIACGVISELAINSLGDDELIAHCVTFNEMLGVNSQVLRAYLKCLRTIKENRGANFSLNECKNEDEIIRQTEEILLRKMQNSNEENAMLDSHQLEPLRIICRAKNIDLPISFLKEVAARSNWFRFLLFAAYHNYSIRSIINVCQMDCFLNRNIGLNIGRALKEIIVEDEMPSAKRTNSFSYREHKRKVQSKIDTSHLLSANNKVISSSMNYLGQIPAAKLISSQYLNINDDMDIFAVILICTCDMRLTHEPSLSIGMLKELMKNPDVHQPTTYLNLIRYAFKMKWPILAVLAATVNDRALDYSWFTWLIISVELTAIPSDIVSFDELTQTVITYAVQQNYVRTLHQSFELFYPESKFALFTKFLSETSRYRFTSETSNLLMDFLYEIGEGTVSLNSLLTWSDENLLDFSTALLIEYVKQSFDSMEHCQQLLDTICASGIANYIDSIDFCTIAAIHRIICFTKVRLNIDEMVCREAVTINDEDLDETDADGLNGLCLQNEYIRICDELVAEKMFTKAMEMAELLNLPKDSIIYEQWIHLFETNETFDFDVCDREIAQHSLSPLLLINFLIFVAEKMSFDDVKKYTVLKKILDSIKRHHLYPNEAIQRDAIECDMYKCVLRNGARIDKLDVYNSDYFETIMRDERCVLYKSFLDLKDLSGVDELTILHKGTLSKEEIDRLEILMNRLLDQGDIVQVLRLQAMFNHRTLDMHYLVFCMALAESLASLYDLSVEQKQMLNDGVKMAASKFNRRTLRLKRLSTSCSTSISSSPMNKTYFDTLEATRFDFDEIPSGEKQHLLEAIQSLASRVKHGFKIAQRVAMAFRSAMHLEKEYLDVLQTKDPLVLLQNAVNDPCLNRLQVMSDIMTSMQLTAIEIAKFMAEEVSKSIIKSRFYLLQSSVSHSFGQNYLWDYDLDKDFHLFLELCPNTSILGSWLLKYCDALKIYRKFDSVKNVEPALETRQTTEELHEIFNNLRVIMENQMLSHKKQNTISVELLIKAHDCFVHECSMEGIAFVLQRCKAITLTLAAAKSWHLIVKLLMGVRRYRDMYYCFETLIENDQFESLLGQFDEDRASGFKEAIISYLHEHHPEDKENYRLAALHFQMFKELAHIAEEEARAIVDKILKQTEIRHDDNVSMLPSSTLARFSIDVAVTGGSVSTSNINGNVNAAISSSVSFLSCTKQVAEALNAAMDLHAHAAENYLLENKLGLAQRAASNAELVALQINLVRVALDDNKSNCMCVLNIRNENTFRYLVNNVLNIPQALILSRAYPYEIIWTESIFNQYVCQGKEDYIVEYSVRMELTDEMIEHLVKNFLQLRGTITSKMEKAISIIVEMVQSVTLRYKLASVLSDKRIIANLINGECLYYLKDTNYGRNECL